MLLGPAVEDLAQGVLAADDAEELVLGRRQVDVRRAPRRRSRWSSARRCPRATARGRAARWRWMTSTSRALRPRPTVRLAWGSMSTQSTRWPSSASAPGEVDGGRRLADPALLVGDRDDASHGRPPMCRATRDDASDTATDGSLANNRPAATNGYPHPKVPRPPYLWICQPSPQRSRRDAAADGR